MPELTRSSGLKIIAPESFDISGDNNTAAPNAGPPRGGTPPRGGRRFGPIPMPTATAAATPSSPAGETDALVAAFASQEMKLVDTVELLPRPGETAAPAGGGTRSRSPRAVPETQRATLELDLSPGEDAVVLVEQEGVYSWVFPTRRSTAEVRAPGATRRGPAAAAATTTQHVTFEIELRAAGTPPPMATRRDRRGPFTDFVRSRLKAIVLKFAARLVVGQAMSFLERNVARGIVVINSEDPTQWQRVEDLSDPLLALPADRPARVLLLVHGTFSSTLGSYGALGSTPWGREFLAAARTNYDAVIGFDHPTLSVDPLANATDLLNRLQRGIWAFPPRFHAVAFSRGALVFRSLVEHLLPRADWPASFDRAVFVGSTNGGTRLAEPDNWHALVDLYTNLATAAARVIGLMPQATAVSAILAELVQGVGALVKYMATEAVTAGGVPGLAAMQRGGEFVTRINETQPGQPIPARTWYYAITSEFKARLLGGEHEPRELPKRLALALADGLVDRLMGDAPNDLVVDTASMTALDLAAGAFIRDTLDFGVTPHVYHLNYFTRPEVTNALARWLQLAAPPAAPAVSARRAPPGTRPATAVAIHRVPLRTRTPAGFAPTETGAAVDTDIYVTDVLTPVAEARAAVVSTAPSYVVLQRAYRGEKLNYAFPAERFYEQVEGRRPEQPLIEALNLHETDRARTRSSSAASRATSGQAEVILTADEPVGVLPQAEPILDTNGLVALARRTLDPGSVGDQIAARRALPTFAPGESVVPTTAAAAAATPGAARRGRTGGDQSRSTRGRGSAPPAGPSSKPQTPRAQCHFRAEMDEEVALNHAATVEVNVSREVIGGVVHATAAAGVGTVDVSRRIVLQVIAKRNFALCDADQARIEIDPPAPDAPQTFYFDVRATHEDGGEGELWVVARQGQVPLVTLSLRPRIVSKRTGGGGRRAASSATSAEARPLSAPLTQLFITEKLNGSQVSYEFLLQAPDLQVLARGESRPLRGSREEYVRKLYSEIENRWVSTKRDVKDFYEELRAYGAELFDALVPEKVQAALWRHREAINSIMVIAEEPFIPWEVVHVKEPGKPLTPGTRFLGEMGLVRWLHEAGWPVETIPLRRGKARYVIPVYPHDDYVLPETQPEREFLERTFEATPVEPTSSAVRKALNTPGGFDLLHFAGHGEAEVDDQANAALLLQGRVEDGKFLPEYFNATTAEHHSAFQQDGQPGPMIVLNACQVGRASYRLTDTGGFARAFLRRGASAFVGTLWSVGDRPARAFTEEFYRQMKNKALLANAARNARAKAREDGDATWLAYVVYGHPHATLTSG